MRITVTVLSGSHKGQVFAFTGHDTFLVGRSRHAHLRMSADDKFCSRMHCLIEFNPPACRVLDLGSNNGTHVNGARVQSAELKSGDRIRVGRTMLELEFAGAAEDAEPPRRALPRPKRPTVPSLPAMSKIRECPVCDVRRGTAAIATAGPWTLCPACQFEASELPQDIPGYRLVHELGRGSMGVVYLALDEAGWPAAVKTIVPAVAGNGKAIARFLREAEILRSLRHPRIVAFAEMGESNGTLYLAMEYVPGQDASKVVHREGRLEVGRAVRWACQLLEALEYAHGRKFVHRDVKPSNLLVAGVAGAEEVRLSDFGLARVYQASELSGLTLTGEFGGTLAYMAPEQIENFRESAPAVDQYGAAATLYYLLTGKFALGEARTQYEVVARLVEGKVVPLRNVRADVPEGLARVVERGLAREPKRRFADVGEMRRALEPHGEI